MNVSGKIHTGQRRFATQVALEGASKCWWAAKSYHTHLAPLSTSCWSSSPSPLHQTTPPSPRNPHANPTHVNGEIMFLQHSCRKFKQKINYVKVCSYFKHFQRFVEIVCHVEVVHDIIQNLSLPLNVRVRNTLLSFAWNTTKNSYLQHENFFNCFLCKNRVERHEGGHDGKTTMQRWCTSPCFGCRASCSLIVATTSATSKPKPLPT
jgi:hypothetical protein